MRVENTTRKVNKRSRIRAWRWRRAKWWWRIELIRNTKSRRKLVSQVRGGIPEGAVCDHETEVKWWLEKSSQCGWSSGSRRLDCDEIAQVTWRIRLENLICGGNNFVFNAFLYLKPVQRFENRVMIGGPGICNNSTSKSILDTVEGDLTVSEKDISTVHRIAVVKSGIDKRTKDVPMVRALSKSRTQRMRRRSWMW